ncbi:1,2-oxophytodienoate reductase [Paenibacillus riograndensis]|uniref:1,2-oxophytodienoate reductase n=1 Tax=Paenibacillus riograndensis TaxID=483937 RepID=A0A132UA85_9BACL|nr:NADH:flavin oxidoreductase [Paenibacillus riograndensis]KWX80614.1 1,2-oxophytodienoate reductase [Paenibacillus riograndensis]KWX89398.1 1,2-oxophytodienoate reductase [Paenibacillus riograndensis]
MSNEQQHIHSLEALFEPYKVQKLTIPARIVMSPMARAFSPGGVPGEDVAAYYRRRAENEVGLIITEGVVIDHPAASSEPRLPSIYGEAAMNGWREVVRQVHEAGGTIFPQLVHMGMIRPMGAEPFPKAPSIGPSGLDLEGRQVTEPMTEEEIAGVIQAFANAAANAKQIGFDGVELHGAHGFLIDQFFWEKTNQRTDRYGGDFLKRTQFAVQVVQAVRAAVGPDYPVSMRLSQWKMGDYAAKLVDTPEQLEQFLNVLVKAGVDIFHISTRRFWDPEFEGSELSLAGWVKKLSGKTTITVGSVGIEDEPSEDGEAGRHGLEELQNRLERQEFDLIAVGRALLGDPAWAKKIREGRIDEIKAFTPEATAVLF